MIEGWKPFSSLPPIVGGSGSIDRLSLLWYLGVSVSRCLYTYVVHDGVWYASDGRADKPAVVIGGL